MRFCREFYIAAGKAVAGLQVVPVLEVWLVAGDSVAWRSCAAMVRPVGFAILAPDEGYWLAGPGDVRELAHAVARATADARAS